MNGPKIIHTPYGIGNWEGCVYMEGVWGLQVVVPYSTEGIVGLLLPYHSESEHVFKTQ